MKKMFETESNVYYQVYAFDIMKEDQRNKLNEMLKTRTLAAPLDKHFENGSCIVFCVFEIEKPLPDPFKEKTIAEPIVNKSEKKADEHKTDDVYVEGETPTNKLLHEVKHASKKKK